jgi:hypothetical protein
VVAGIAVYRADCHPADCHPAEGATPALNPPWSLPFDHHPNTYRLIGLFSPLTNLRLDAGVEFPQLLPETFHVGNYGGQTIVAFPFHPSSPW